MEYVQHVGHGKTIEHIVLVRGLLWEASCKGPIGVTLSASPLKRLKVNGREEQLPAVDLLGSDLFAPQTAEQQSSP